MNKVKFTEMKHGTKEDYLLLDKHEKKYIEEAYYKHFLKLMSPKFQGSLNYSNKEITNLLLFNINILNYQIYI